MKRLRQTLGAALAALSLFCSPPLWAESSSYVSGKELCAQEAGDWLQVPHSYHMVLDAPTDRYQLHSDSSGGFTEIFYKVYAEGADIGSFIRPGKPSILYFEGGPAGVAGSRANFFKSISAQLDANVITFEIRGVSCSKPATRAAYEDISSYSAFTIAGDARQLVDHLGLQEVVVYGLSYGTFPARLFSYLFPEVTKSTLLEGTLSLEPQARRDSSAMSQALKTVYSKLFYSSPVEVLEFFSYLSAESEEVFDAWSERYLHNLAKVASFGGRQGLSRYLQELKQNSEDLNAFGTLLAQYPAESPWRQEGTQASSVDFYLADRYLCRDFDRRHSLAQIPLKLTPQGGFVLREAGGFSSEWNEYFATSCLSLRNTEDQSYGAILKHHGGRLPLQAPVMFFNGGLDATTPAGAALAEARTLDAQEVVFLEFEDQGHAPWNLVELLGTDLQKIAIRHILQHWLPTGRVEMAPELKDFLESQKIRVRPLETP